MSNDPFSFSDVTPTRTKLPLAIKVCGITTINACMRYFYSLKLEECIGNLWKVMTVNLLDLILAVGKYVTALYSYIIYFFQRVAFNSPANATVVTRLVKEVQTFNPRYQAQTIKGKWAIILCAY